MIGTLDEESEGNYSMQLQTLVSNWKRMCPMRPPREQRSNLRYPLDEVLGTSALVRLLRVLVHDVGGPVSVTDAGRRAGLSAAGARKALGTLERLNVATRVGTGRALKFGPKEGNSYLPVLRQLFQEEQERYDALVRGLRDAVAIPEIRDAWMKGPSAETPQGLELEVVADAKALSWVGPELRARLAETEKRFDLIVEVNVFTRADSPDVPEGAVRLSVSGEGPLPPRSQGSARSDSTERSHRMAQAIAGLVKSDPSLIRRALHHLDLLLVEDQGTATSDIAEWRTLLETYSTERIRDLLVSRSSRAERLRRSSPFFAVLTPDERDRVFREMESSG